jgi:hypothetical protein
MLSKSKSFTLTLIAKRKSLLTNSRVTDWWKNETRSFGVHAEGVQMRNLCASKQGLSEGVPQHTVRETEASDQRAEESEEGFDVP